MIRTTTKLIMYAIAGCLSWAAASPPARAATQWVMGYYVGYQSGELPPASIPWADLTHIVMGRVTANPDGSLNTNFDIDAVSGPALAREVASRAHAAGRKAILMLGGSDNGAQILSAVTSHRAALIANLIAAMKNYGYDGLDLDWESNINWALFQTFVTQLRQSLPNAILTLPTGPLNLNTDTVDSHIPQIAKQLDRLTLMTYAGATVWSGSGWNSWYNSPLQGETPATPVDIASSLQAYAAAGVPKQKLAMGIGFFAICYTGGVTGPYQPTQPSTLVDDDNGFQLPQIYGTNGSYAERYRHWDAAAVEPYLSLPAPESHGCRYVSVEDEKSVAAKGVFSRANGYGGTILWTLGEGYVPSHPAPNFLLDAVGQAFLNPGAASTVAISIMQGNSWLHTAASLNYDALVTGSANKAVSWAVVQPQCGTINATGKYTAPASEKSCTLTATSKADPTKTAKATVTISNQPWTPAFAVARPGSWWVEITAKDTSVVSLSVQWPDGSASPLPFSYKQAVTNFPIFAAALPFPDAGGSYVFFAQASNNRKTSETLTIPVCVHGADGVCH